jgi:hypothetical protein
MPLPAATLHGAAGIAVPTLVSTLAISCVFVSGAKPRLDHRCGECQKSVTSA